MIEKVVKKYKSNKTRLLDIFWDIQNQYNYVSQDHLQQLSKLINVSVPELNDTLSFYHFFHSDPCGEIKIYVDNSAISEIKGLDLIIEAFEKELNIKLGSSNEKFGLYTTSCIGLSDQAPCALINGLPFNNLTVSKVKSIVQQLKQGKFPKEAISNEVHQKGPLLTDQYTKGEALDKNLHPDQIIDEVSKAGIRGRGGAGFRTGLKWQLCQQQKEKVKYVVCNADEGEPGTFKDRYLLTKHPHMVIEGMCLAAKAIGAQKGLIYLRAEYKYLYDELNKVAQEFDLDIRIQLGAGAYVVGEETALLESLEGKRGEPRVRPPFPVEQGYLGKPTVVNNVETFASVTKIIKHGHQWYRNFGTKESPGTKLLSVSGDCQEGIYEIPWGMSIKEFCHMVKADNAYAVQVGGPSGKMVAADSDRKIAFEDLSTGGSMMVFNNKRDLLRVVKNFTEFFKNESCGCCLPCRAGNIVLDEQMDFILSDRASKIDLERIKSWSHIISASSRCGLGQTCSNPITSSLETFPDLYNNQVREHETLFRHFDVQQKTEDYERVIKEYEKN
ncbi:MAG: NAD(P)H-dependent oxidoreductase subunit E [Bacteriovoracaceae bacterium]